MKNKVLKTFFQKSAMTAGLVVGALAFSSAVLAATANDQMAVKPAKPVAHDEDSSKKPDVIAKKDDDASMTSMDDSNASDDATTATDDSANSAGDSIE